MKKLLTILVLALTVVGMSAAFEFCNEVDISGMTEDYTLSTVINFMIFEDNVFAVIKVNMSTTDFDALAGCRAVKFGIPFLQSNYVGSGEDSVVYDTFSKLFVLDSEFDQEIINLDDPDEGIVNFIMNVYAE